METATPQLRSASERAYEPVLARLVASSRGDRELAALLARSPEDCRRLRRVAFAAGDAVAFLLDGVWVLERELPRGVEDIELDAAPTVRGAVDWPRTLGRLGVSRDGGMEYVCALRGRTNDTPPARLLKFMLLEVARAARLLDRPPFAGVVPEHVRAAIAIRRHEARALLNGRYLRSVNPDGSSRTVADVRRTPNRYCEVLLAVNAQQQRVPTPETVAWVAQPDDVHEAREIGRIIALLDQLGVQTPSLVPDGPGLRYGPLYWAHPSMHGAKGRSAGLWLDERPIAFVRSGEHADDAGRRVRRFAASASVRVISTPQDLRNLLRSDGQRLRDVLTRPAA